MKRIKFAAFLVVIILLLGSENAFSENTKYRFVRIEDLAEQAVAEKLLKDIYKHIGIEIDIEAFPGERAKKMATDGERDGEILRIFSYGEKNKMMIRVPTPYSYLETAVFAKKSRNISVKSKESLKKYKIIVVRGVQHTKDITEGLENIHIVNSIESMMKCLDAERDDVALTNTLAGMAILKKLKNTEIVPVGTLETLDLFHYLHEKNINIVPRVDEVIQTMSKSGELKKLREKYEKEYIDDIQ